MVGAVVAQNNDPLRLESHRNRWWGKDRTTKAKKIDNGENRVEVETCPDLGLRCAARGKMLLDAGRPSPPPFGARIMVRDKSPNKPVVNRSLTRRAGRAKSTQHAGQKQTKASQPTPRSCGWGHQIWERHTSVVRMANLPTARVLARLVLLNTSMGGFSFDLVPHLSLPYNAISPGSWRPGSLGPCPCSNP
jgi:hypothetical protein